MAERCLLHKNKLEHFKWWLSSRGYDIQPVKGLYEVLRAKKGRDTVIVFHRNETKEHLTVQQKDYHLVKQFIQETRDLQRTNDNRIVSFPTENVSLPEAHSIFRERLDDDSLSIHTRTIAIWRVAEMETHNSITKDELVAALRWIFDHYEFEED